MKLTVASEAVEPAMRANYALTLKHFLTTDPDLMAQHEALVKTNIARINGFLSDYEKTLTTPQERTRYDGIKTRRTPYVATFKQILDLSHEGKKKEAEVERRRNETTDEAAERRRKNAEGNRKRRLYQYIQVHYIYIYI